NDIRVNRVVRNLVNAAKDHLREHQALRERVLSASKGTTRQNWDFTEQCLHHNEQFKLFCVTDQELICVICKEETKHRGHKFTPLKDAFHHKKKRTCEALETFLGREDTLIGLIEEQADEVLKTMDKSRSLSYQISAQFEKLHQFLNGKEVELKRHLEDEENQILNIMGVNMFTMEEMLSDGREKIGVIKSALEINQPTKFLQWWTENGRFVTREIFVCDSTCLNIEDLRVTLDTLSLGPHETYLQFFVWKEMLRIIQM
ncbi:nuclear factor 7, brain-like, partial [Clarias magur]